jgi:uncharacterized membrane protein
MGRWLRLVRHLFLTRAAVRRRFTDAVLDRIEAAVKAAEVAHCGEIEVVVETDLSWPAILAGQTSRQRALDVFAAARVWDTEENNGVLIYVLYADRAVEIVADRGFNGLVAPEEWAGVCRLMESEFRAGLWDRGAIAGVEGAARLLSRHFPGHPAGHGNELPDRPLVL